MNKSSVAMTGMLGISGTDMQVINYFINSKLQLAAYMKEIGIRLAAPSSAYLGFSAYFIKQGKHANEKAMKLAFFVQELGGDFALDNIKPYNQSFNDPVAALEAIIGIEEQILMNLKARTAEIRDITVQAFIGDLIKMMAIHLAAKRLFLTRANRVRNDPAGLQRLNDELLLLEMYAKHHHKFHGHHHDHHHHHHMKC
jgi:ferritin